MNGKFGLGLGVVVCLAMIGGLLYLALAPVEDGVGERSGRDRKPAKEERSVKREGKLREAKPSVAKRNPNGNAATPKRQRRPHMEAPKDWFEHLPPRDRDVAKRLQDAQDADNQEGVFAAAEEALASKNDELRKNAVESLSLQGAAAMPLLLKFMGDGSAEVADDAYRAWDDAVDTLDGDINKLSAVREAIGVIKSKENMSAAVGKIESFDQARAIRELAKIARGNGAAAEAAKESYENVTGEKFENWAAAELKALAIDRDNAAAEGGEQ